MAAADKSRGSRPGWLAHSGWIIGLALAGLSVWKATPLMTGQVSAAHAAIETQCSACHSARGSSQDEACRGCHPTIGATSPAAIHRTVREACAACHHEHRSREYPLRLDDPRSFPHDRTTFPLGRWHAGVDCLACHPSGQPYYAVARHCADCHPSWSAATFDHARITGVGLARHPSAACTDCHPKKRYEETPTCGSCHDPLTAWHGGQQL